MNLVPQAFYLSADCCGIFCTSLSEHALSFLIQPSLVRAVTMATAHREPRYRIIQAHTMLHMHVYVTGIADSSKTNGASMITVIFVFTSR